MGKQLQYLEARAHCLILTLLYTTRNFFSCPHSLPVPQTPPQTFPQGRASRIHVAQTLLLFIDVFVVFLVPIHYRHKVGILL